MVDFVGNAVTVEENVESVADFFHPLLDCWQGSKGNDEDARVEPFEFFLVGAQLCGVFTTGYSAKMAEEDEQDMIAAF